MKPRLAVALAALSVVALPRTVRADEQHACTRGVSGALRVCTVAPQAHVTLEQKLSAQAHLRWVPRHQVGNAVPASAVELRAPASSGTWALEQSEDGVVWRPQGLELITRVLYDGSRDALNGYVIGKHPGTGRSGVYRPPEWFIEVTPGNKDYPVSESFRLGQFLTKNQQNVWPKYVPLNLKLVDKLERIVQELRKEGVPAQRVHVMSGYRTPRYNGPGGNGRAKFSRHTYGDAADIWVDDDGDGVMDDLNRDGRVDDADAEYLVMIAGRVEAAHPELVGGAGIYKANRVHGPFTHVDVRGTAARWSKR